MLDENNDFENNEIEENEENEIKDSEMEVENLDAESLDADFKSERRNTKRFDERLTARIENESCVVLNVSNKGVLLQTSIPVYFFPLSSTIEFQLQVEGEWLHVVGRVMWIQSDVLHSKIGLFIQQAPEPYFNFLRTLYE